MENLGNNFSQGSSPYHYSSASMVENELTMKTYVAKVMRRVFGKMSMGILATAFISMFIASNDSLLNLFFSTPWLFWGLIIAEFGLVVFLSARINKLSAGTASLLFYLYAAINGVTLTPLFMVYTSESIATTFFITAGTFGAMAAYGYITRSDLSKIGSILFMALIGLIIASIVNIFLHSSMVAWVISVGGVLIFVGLTAWDTQKIKRMAEETVGEENVSKVATIGALELYLDFVNLFIYLLRIFGKRN